MTEAIEKMRKEDPMYRLVEKYTRKPVKLGTRKMVTIELDNPGRARVPEREFMKYIKNQGKSEAEEAASGSPGKWEYSTAGMAYIAESRKKR